MCVCSIFTTRILQGPLKNRVIFDFNQPYSKNLFISISFVVDLSGPYSLGMEYTIMIIIIIIVSDRQ